MSENSSSIGALGPDDLKKLKQTMEAGLRIKQEIADLSGGLKDTVKSVAEEYGIKPADFMRAINSAFKAKHADEKQSFDTVEDILNVTGYA